ncbi:MULTISPECIES: endo alpha-1,4 polygalactosaminidase [Thalassospira]|uniref:Endo alpha-1,4 polygalactosaminidase n=1 Tax=Thalassospira aquimaris TaxID=3037796 RepID=A0ABT6GGQ5_9PROT|nr:MULTISPECIES: endo alpha-1,4 polygalactosaminidase [Thalassospira]MDG4721270.1 endo alpha-1,4 polygalactosaminidase [Thalassospira sp. FZY0004]
MVKRRQDMTSQNRGTIAEQETLRSGPDLSRRRFLAGSALGLGSAILASRPFSLHAQQLEPFIPAPNSLSNGRNLDSDNGKPRVQFTEEMRSYVIAISRWAKSYRNDFSVIAMNGLELTEFLETTLFATRGTAEPARDYLRALDGILSEAPFYGYEHYGEKTKEAETKYILGYLERLKYEGLQYLVVDYTNNSDEMQAAREQLSGLDALYYAAPPPGKQLSSLAKVPRTPIGSNPHVIDNLRQAKNFALVLDSSPYGTKEAYLDALVETNYDTLIIDPFHRGTIPLTYDDMKRLRYKRTGTPRTIMAYLNIGTAETFRYYWKSNWRTGSPDFIGEGNLLSRWGQEHHVYFWKREWQNLIYGSEGSYLGGIMKLGFDGVLLGGLDEYAWWQDY